MHEKQDHGEIDPHMLRQLQEEFLLECSADPQSMEVEIKK